MAIGSIVARGSIPARLRDRAGHSGGVDEGEWFEQAINIRIWAAALNWFPTMLVTDSRVRWEPVDDSTALLRVPVGMGEDLLVVRFDPDSGKVRYLEVMKSTAPGKKELWVNNVWFEQGRSWLRLEVEDVVYNAEVERMIRTGSQ